MPRALQISPFSLLVSFSSPALVQDRNSANPYIAAYEFSTVVSLVAECPWLNAGKIHFRDLAGFKHLREHKNDNVDLGLRFGF